MDAFAASHHEAGHCVAAHVKGIRTVKVTIANDNPRWHYGPFPPEKGEAYIVCCFAGLEGERIWDSDTPEGVAKVDRETASEVFRYDIATGDEAAYMAKRAQEARDIVQEHRRAVKALAVALMRRKTLTGKQALKIITAFLTEG